MKLFCFIAIEVFFAAEFIYENSFSLCVLHFRLFYTNVKYVFNKNSHEEKFTIIIPTVIDCSIMKYGGCENHTKTKPTKSNLTQDRLFSSTDS